MYGIPVGDFHTFPFRFEGVVRKQTARPRHPVGMPRPIRCGFCITPAETMGRERKKWAITMKVTMVRSRIRPRPSFGDMISPCGYFQCPEEPHQILDKGNTNQYKKKKQERYSQKTFEPEHSL